METINKIVCDEQSEIGLQWELAKQEIKMKPIERSTSLRKAERLQGKHLRDMLETLLVQECKAPGLYSEDIKKTKQKLELIEEERYRGALVRARAVDWAAGQKPTKRAIAMEKAHARRNQIQEVEWEVAVVTDNGGIHRAFFEYYQALFAQNEVDVSRFQDEFLGAMPRLDDARKESLELPITEQDVQRAVENLIPGKSPGPDGLSTAFIKSLKRELTPLLTFLFNDAYARNELPPSYGTSHTVLIRKADDTQKL